MAETQSNIGHAKPSGGFELASWVFMRVSGVVLLGLALGHLWIMHIQHGVDQIDYDFVARRWSLVLWRGYDLSMLLLALLHGTNGLRIILDDMIRSATVRRWSIRILYAVTLILIVLGTWVVVAFQKPSMP